MSEHQSHEGLSRRDALRIIAGSVAVAAHCPTANAAVAGTLIQDPGSAAPSLYRPKFFSPEQMQSLDVLTEIIIPADEHSPGAHAARVNEYIDGIISESSEQQKRLWQEGIAAVDRMAVLAHGKPFKDCDQQQQGAMVERISVHEDQPTTVEEKFFVTVKKATVVGYYTSEIGIHQDLQYQGNDVLASFEGCTHEHHS